MPWTHYVQYVLMQKYFTRYEGVGGCSGILVCKWGWSVTVNFALFAQEELQYVITFSPAWK